VALPPNAWSQRWCAWSACCLDVYCMQGCDLRGCRWNSNASCWRAPEKSSSWNPANFVGEDVNHKTMTARMRPEGSPCSGTCQTQEKGVSDGQRGRGRSHDSAGAGAAAVVIIALRVHQAFGLWRRMQACREAWEDTASPALHQHKHDKGGPCWGAEIF